METLSKNMDKENELIACHEALYLISEFKQRGCDETIWQPPINKIKADIKRLEQELELTPHNYGIENNHIVLEEC